MGNCCTWPREDDGDVSSDYGQSTLDTEEPKQESEGSYSVRWCVGESEDLANFRIHDGITIGDPPWYELPLPPTWPPCTAGCFQRLWLKALPATI